MLGQRSYVFFILINISKLYVQKSYTFNSLFYENTLFSIHLVRLFIKISQFAKVIGVISLSLIFMKVGIFLLF